mgnify:FL=1
MRLLAVIFLSLEAFSAVAASGADIRRVSVDKPYFRWLFGGFGSQHSEASLTALMTDEFRDQRCVKSLREIGPTFGRGYIGFAEISKEHLDRFADYYDLTFRQAQTTLYVVPCAIGSFPERLDPDEYAEKVAASLDYLIKTRKRTKIRYYCLTNELVAGGKCNYFEAYNQMDNGANAVCR